MINDLIDDYTLGKLNFRNELIKRLNENVDRYKFIVNGEDVEFFNVDEIYDIIDRVYDGISEDDGSID